VKGWTKWEQGAAFLFCHNKRLGLEAEATCAGGWWTVSVYQGGWPAPMMNADAKSRNRDEALAKAVASLPRRRIAR
jgi:hypothetical protein